MSKTTWRDKLNMDQQALIEDILKQLPPLAVWGYEALLNKIAQPKHRYLIIDGNEVQGTNDEDIVAAADDSGDYITLLTEAIPEASRSDWDIEEDEEEEDDE